MRKIIQFLRLSRLVLLVILLLFAVAAKIARAETARLYFAGSAITGYHASGDAACKTEFNYIVGTLPNDHNGGQSGSCLMQLPGWTNPQANGSYSSKLHTCDAKELTHNGEYSYDGYSPVTSSWFWHDAPKGDDAALWFPDRYESCENNCVVKNNRIPLSGGAKAVYGSDGYSSSAFTKRQTGEVCVPESKKKDDPPKSPPADNGDSSSQGNTGNTGGSQGESGNSQGGENSGGTGSQNDGNNQGSGDSNNSGANGSGSGGGSGGGSGSGGHTGPSGGGTGGSSDSGSENEGGEGSAEGGESGSGENGSPGGESGSESGGEGSGQGNVGGTEGGQNGESGGDGESGEAGGHYFPCPSGKGSYKKGTEPSAECLGEGKGSIGGGSCDTDTPPECKGDPVQCYIAKEQWRTACAASGKSNKIEGEGNCQEKEPPQCKGDAVQCYIAKQQWQQGCAAAAAQDLYDELGQYGNSQKDYLDELQKEGNPEGLLRDIKLEKIDLSGQLKTNLVNLPGACPSFPALDLGVFGSHQIPTDNLCDMLRSFGRILLALSYVFAFGIVVRAF